MKPEQQTRQEEIDLQLGRAGWATGSQFLIKKFPITPPSSLKEPETRYNARNKFAGCAPLDRLAIVEAKHSELNPLEAERRASDCADAILAQIDVDPFIILASGDEVWFWQPKLELPRKVSGDPEQLFAKVELSDLIAMIQHLAA